MFIDGILPIVKSGPQSQLADRTVLHAQGKDPLVVPVKILIPLCICPVVPPYINLGQELL